MRLAIKDELDRRWVAAATDEQLAFFRDFIEDVIEGMARVGFPSSPCPRYWCVLREIERRQLLAEVGDGTASRARRL
jgi:hypothetical protein